MPNDNDDLKVTSAEEWEEEAAVGQLVPLPSGKVVRIKRTMDMLTLLKVGKIPNPLKGVMQGMIEQGKPIPTMADMDEKQLVQMLVLIDQTCVESITEPEFVLPPAPKAKETAEAYAERIKDWKPDKKEGEKQKVGINRMDMTDRMFVFAFAQGAAGDLDSFRAESSAAMAHVLGQPAVPDKAK